MIDLITPDCIPRSIDVIPAEAEEHNLPGGQRIFVESFAGVDIECVFGINGMIAEDLKQLELLRGHQGLHMLSFDNIDCGERVDLLTYMPKVQRTSVGWDSKGGNYAYGETTIRFRQINPTFSLIFFEFWFFENAGYSTGNSKWVLPMPAAGRFIAGGLSGHWFDVIGAGADEIEIQFRNQTQGFDYLSTVGRFKTSTGKPLQDGIFGTNLSFVKDDLIALDIDQITTGSPAANSAIFVVQAAAEVFG